jgi:hypothetical protein
MRAFQWKPLQPPPPRAVIEAFKMVDDAIPIDEHLLWIALEEVVKEKHGWEHSNGWDERICEFCGCDFRKPPECHDQTHDTCSKCAPKHKCARYVGDWHTRDVRSDDARDHEWRTDRDGCIRRDRERLEHLRSDMCEALESWCQHHAVGRVRAESCGHRLRPYCANHLHATARIQDVPQIGGTRVRS